MLNQFKMVIIDKILSILIITFIAGLFVVSLDGLFWRLGKAAGLEYWPHRVTQPPKIRLVSLANSMRYLKIRYD